MKSHTLIVIVLVTLSGCAGTQGCLSGFCPGSPAFEAVAQWHDRRDPCQGDHRSSTAERRAQLERADNYTRPDWCGASRGKVISVQPVGTNRYLVNRY